jgi:hypothetical protein
LAAAPDVAAGVVQEQLAGIVDHPSPTVQLRSDVAGEKRRGDVGILAETLHIRAGKSRDKATQRGVNADLTQKGDLPAVLHFFGLVVPPVSQERTPGQTVNLLPAEGCQQALA